MKLFHQFCRTIFKTVSIGLPLYNTGEPNFSAKSLRKKFVVRDVVRVIFPVISLQFAVIGLQFAVID